MAELTKEKVLIVSPNCPSCEVVKAYLNKKGVLSKYTVIDVSTPDGMRFAEKLGVMGVPDCAIIENNTVRVCTDGEWREMLGE